MSPKSLMTRALVLLLAVLGAGQAMAARTTTYFHTDALGSVVAATSEAGAVLWRKDYAPYGAQLPSSTGTEKLSYTGKPHDAQLGITNFGARQYDPEIGRFLNVDPVGFVESNPMSFNRYLYVNDNPYKYVDPDGEFLNFVAKFVLDVGVNVAINYLTTGELNVGSALKDSAVGILNPAKTVAKTARLAKLVAKTNKNAGDAGAALTKNFAGKQNRQDRLKDLVSDDKVPSADRGWIRQEMNEVARGKKGHIRNPPGKDLAHERGREGAKGYGFDVLGVMFRYTNTSNYYRFSMDSERATAACRRSATAPGPRCGRMRWPTS